MVLVKYISYQANDPAWSDLAQRSACLFVVASVGCQHQASACALNSLTAELRFRAKAEGQLAKEEH